MFDRVPPHNDKLNEEIERVLLELLNHIPTDPEYPKIRKELEKLYALRDLNSPKAIDPNTVLLVAANLTGIVLIVGFERANVVTSKAMTLLQKTR